MHAPLDHFLAIHESTVTATNDSIRIIPGIEYLTTRSHAPRGNAVCDAPRRLPARSPVGRHRNQCLDSRIVSGTGIPPVRRIADVTLA